ncbi:hypothetical protein KJ934_00095 [Patescibacteria group bacterium]|nr:hypothetical protein [Patescibacteria group bacterium]MBU4477287.1 hypothetical protein [Patescibacteria group bacterium]MCG2699200.1 hypothetical protein [Candidatus Parcubacteria bacterium]
MERTLKIFISCALGAGIGTLVALELNHYFWWLGLLAGGLVGYLSYEFKMVVSATRQSWHPDFAKIFWRTLTIASMVTSSFVFGVLVYWTITHGYPDGYWAKELFVLTFFSYNIPFAAALYKLISELCSREKEFSAADWRKTLWFTNPIAIIVYWPLWILWKAPRFIIKQVFLAIQKVVVFLIAVFVLIHSDIRLLCGVDAAIGAGIGYYAGSVIVGMLAGGILGVINYEIVSRRLLKLHLH